MFINKIEKEISNEYLENGFVIRNIDNHDSLNFISNYLYKLALNKIGERNIEKNKLFNYFHDFIEFEKINDVRMSIIHEMVKSEEVRYHYYLISKFLLDHIVGNEIAMQLRINLSIQLPNDKSSLLQVHADTWSGDSPFEVVVWLPLVDCYKTKSMYILNPKDSMELSSNFSEIAGNSSEDLYKAIKNKIKWIDIKYGQVLVFNQGLPHGNRVNLEKETRWSMNCRFKGIFTPYNDKRIGEFFEPITLKATSIAGMRYKEPK